MNRATQFMLLSICLCALALYPCFALADTVFGNWAYTLNNEGQAVITHYNGWEKNVSLPWNLQGKLVAEIGPEAFSGNRAIETVKLPIGVTVIRENAFRDCPNLKSVELPDRLETIEDGAFLGCTKLADLVIPDSVAELGEQCFENWTVLRGSENSIAGAYARAVGMAYDGSAAEEGPEEAPDSPDYGYEIRNGAAVITVYLGGDHEVMIPSVLGGYPVRAIGENAFSSQYGVEKVIVPEGVRELERVAFRYCTGLKAIQLPSTMQVIGDNCFYRCESLEEIVIPEGVAELGDRAFQGCISLRRVTLPASLGFIYRYTFFECHKQLIICGPSHSAAESYADQMGCGFISIPR